MPKWLEDAVFYEIYPQSFYDSNGDGIGDIEGIIQKLDYVKDLGCNGIWLNPCFDSPFKDAGYDVRDYQKVAPRYGTNQDLYRLFEEAHNKGIRVILDLVPGHTSEEHTWFMESKKPEENIFSNRYIWTDSWFKRPEGFAFIGGEADRDGAYILNFFKCQPALNYGFLNVKEGWQLPPNHPDCIATREALMNIMRFWLQHGADGFRVDMADSLVKNDDALKSGTSSVWKAVRAMLDKEFPEAFIVSEWSSPDLSLKAGFHADFLLDHEDSGYKSLVRNYKIDRQTRKVVNDISFFKKDCHHDISKFLSQYLPWYEKTKNDGYISLITGNHDTPRISLNLDRRELALAYAVLFTMPGVPFIYYGDEIGMEYNIDLPTKEGGYTRTGSRTPMQWLRSGLNAGFSTAPADKLYLPVDIRPNAPYVDSQQAEPSSLLNIVKILLRLRHAESDLQAIPNFELVNNKEFFNDTPRIPFAYKRGNLVCAVNPLSIRATSHISILGSENLTATLKYKKIFSIGKCTLMNGGCIMEPQSFGIWRIV
ncbi:MAG: hypothetical protein LBG05_10275 [Treponema sp.]|jgi:maltose alpha-D-glucosyltransferase/alpha-amylase|nr:hypothetical protein [Treponema sp.]